LKFQNAFALKFQNVSFAINFQVAGTCMDGGNQRADPPSRLESLRVFSSHQRKRKKAWNLMKNFIKLLDPSLIGFLRSLYLSGQIQASVIN